MSKRVFEESDIREGLEDLGPEFGKRAMLAIRRAREARLREVLDRQHKAAWERYNALQNWKTERQRTEYKKAERALKRVWNAQDRLGVEFAELYGL